MLIRFRVVLFSFLFSSSLSLYPTAARRSLASRASSPRSFLSPQSFHPISLTLPLPQLPAAPQPPAYALPHAAVMAALSESIKVVLMRLNYHPTKTTRQRPPPWSREAFPQYSSPRRKCRRKPRAERYRNRPTTLDFYLRGVIHYVSGRMDR